MNQSCATQALAEVLTGLRRIKKNVKLTRFVIYVAFSFALVPTLLCCFHLPCSLTSMEVDEQTIVSEKSPPGNETDHATEKPVSDKRRRWNRIIVFFSLQLSLFLAALDK